jgi:hypothetical protein
MAGLLRRRVVLPSWFCCLPGHGTYGTYGTDGTALDAETRIDRGCDTELDTDADTDRENNVEPEDRFLSCEG